MEILVLSLFCVVLTVCVIFDFSIIYALLAGLLIFCVYAKAKKYTWRQLFDMIISGVKTLKNILIVLILIGILTALWRSCGTIPIIITYAVRLIRPETFILTAFILNCLVSVLTGTAFGTAATMGVICMSMGNAMNIEPMILGGAILAGTFFGDRCSPVSTSALLVSELTDTDIFKNIKNMLRTAFVPFILTCAIYTLTGIFTRHGESVIDLNELFGSAFNLHWSLFIPALIIIIMSLFKINVKITMLVSIVSAFILSMIVQHTGFTQALRIMLFGYVCENKAVASMINGGGILSMLNVTAIVFISSAYVGIFQKTGLLDSVHSFIKSISRKTTPFGASLFTAAVTSMITCNQTLSIMLTNQLCEGLESDKEKTAVNLEDTAVIISTLIPWAIGSSVPLASIGAPMTSILFACFIYILPIWNFAVSVIKKHKNNKSCKDEAVNSI